MSKKTVAIGSDHAGLSLKEPLKAELAAMGYEPIDVGTFSEDSVDYPDFAYAVAEKIKSKKADMGVLICGSGQGVAIAANRFPFIRAAVCRDAEDAKLSRQHNDANVLTLGARRTSADEAKKCLHAFFETKFEGGRHERRVEKLSKVSS
jgi:ribose 5-phosphate isomerase B